MQTSSLMTIMGCSTAEGEVYTKRSTGTPIEYNIPQTNVKSKWFLETETFDNMYLKVGWNMFGGNPNNQFRIKSRVMKSVEFFIHVANVDAEPPSVFTLHGNVMVDGHKKLLSPFNLCDRTTIGVVRAGGVVYFRFNHDCTD